MKKLFRKMTAVLLSAFMMAGNSTVYVDAINDKGSDNLNNKVSNFSVTDANDQPIQNNQVQAGTSYKLELNFAENDNGEFTTNEMSYAIPEGMSLTLNPDPSSFDMTVTDLNGQQENVTIHNNTYTIRDGKIIVNWNQDEISKLKGTINAQFSIQANAVFAENKKGYDIDGDGKTDITVNGNHDVSVWKSGYYDTSRKQMHYTISAKSYGQNTNVNVTDTVKGSLLTLNAKTWNMTITRNGQPAGNLSATLNNDGKGFTSVIGNMSDNEEIKYDYYADVDLTNIGDGYHLTEDQTGNNVTVQKDGKGDTSSSTSVDHIDYSTISKTAGTPSDASASGVRTVPWTIEINKEQGKDLSNTTLSDAIDQNSRSFTSYSGEGITIQEIDQNGNLIGSPALVKWSDLASYTQSSGWSYKFPENTGNRGFRITYTTDVDASGFKVTTKVSNTTTTDSTGRSATGTVDVKPSNTELKLTKDAVETNWEFIKWRYTITVPKSGTDKAVVTDTLPAVYYGNGWLRDTLKGSDLSAINVEGLKKGIESYSVQLFDADGKITNTLEDAVKFAITFTHDDNMPGFASNDGNRNIVVSYESNNNQDWLRSVEGGQNNQATHRNNVVLDYGSTLEAHADAVPARTSISKVVSHFSGDSIYSEVSDENGHQVKVPVWKFAVTLQGVHSDSIEINDTYDDNLKGLVKVADDNDLKNMYQNGHHAAYLYYGDYAPNDQWPETTNIDVRNHITEKEDGTGFTFNLNNIPKKDNNGGYYNYYTLFYVLIPKNYDSYQAIEEKAAVSDNSELKMKNKATWNNMSSSSDFSYTYPNVKKTIAYYQADNNGKPGNSTTGDSSVLTQTNNKVKFTLDVNPDGKDLVSGKDSYTMTDTFTSGNISPDVDSIKIMQGSNDITDQCKYDLKQDGTGIVFTLPDSKALTITYDAHITSNGSGEYANKIVNTAEIKGYTSSTDGTSRINWNATGGSETVSAVIRKSVYGNLRQTINGAQYTLYDGDGSRGYDGVKVSGPFTTDANGKATITGKKHENGDRSDSLLLNHMYYLMETSAPAGYQKDTTPHVFQLVKDPSQNRPNQITVGTEILLTDQVENFRIIKEGTDGKKLAGATFTLSGGDLKENQTVTTGGDGVASFSGLTGGQSYTLTETSAPDGYEVSGGPWTVTLDQNLMPTADGLTFDKSSINGVSAYSATVTDKKNTISISGNKVWKDDGINRPSSVTLELQKLNKDSGKYDPVKKQDVGPGTDNKWSYSFDGLDPDETYQVIEKNTNKNYQSSIGTKDNGWQVVNTKTGTIDIPVKKVWVNGESAAHVSLVRRLHGQDNNAWKPVNEQVILTTGKDAEHTFKDLPLYDENGNKYEYSVQEAPLEGYKLPEITGNQETGFTITNIKLDTSASINATKVLVGRTLSAGEFTFSLSEKTDNDYASDKTGGVNETAVNQADGSVQFNTLNYTYTQNKGQNDDELKDDHYYVLSEVNSGEQNITYDQNTYRVHVHNEYDASARKMKSYVEYLSSTDNGTTWTPVDSSNVRFTNTYTPKSTTAELQANKIVTGRENVNRSFTLKLESLEGAPMPADVTTGIEKDVSVSTGQVKFGNITYTQAGTYRYRISEVVPAPENRNGYEYDQSIYLATVKVTDQEGQLHADISYQNTNGSDTEKDDTNVTIPTFTNRFSYTPVQAKLKVTKGFTERAKNALGDGQSFSFTLRSENKTIETEKITATAADADQTITFDKLSFDKPGAYNAIIFENDLTDDQKNAGWIKDGRSYNVTFNVVENTDSERRETGTLRVDSVNVDGQSDSITLDPTDQSYTIPGTDNQPTFENDFDSGVTTEYLHISKYVSGYPDGKENNDTFSFHIKAEKVDGITTTPIADPALTGTNVTNDGNGNYTVSRIKAGNAWTSDPLTFDSNKTGYYQYTITEEKDTDKSYYTYSDDTYTVKIHVYTGTNGKLTHTTVYKRDKGEDTSGDYYQDDKHISTAQFINKYNVKPITIYPAIWKKMASPEALQKAQNDKNAKFTFTLTGNDENPGKKFDSQFRMKAVVDKDHISDSEKKYVRFYTVNKDGTLSATDGLTFEKSYGTHNIYTFNVTEDDPGKPYTKDDAVYQAKFDLEDEGNGNQSIKRMQITRNGAIVYDADHDQLSDVKVTDSADVAIPDANTKLNTVDETSDVKKHIRQNEDNTYEADVLFTDDYVPETTSAEISVAKILKGYPDNGLNSYSFNFQLKGTEGNKKYGEDFSDIETVIVGNTDDKNQKTGSVKFMSDSTASNTKFMFDQTGIYEFTIDELYTSDSNADLKSEQYKNYTRYTGITKDDASTTIHVFVDVADNNGKLSSSIYYTRDEGLVSFVHSKKRMPNWLENNLSSFTYLNPYKTSDAMDEENKTASFHNTYHAESAKNADFPMHKGFTINGESISTNPSAAGKDFYFRVTPMGDAKDLSYDSVCGEGCKWDASSKTLTLKDHILTDSDIQTLKSKYSTNSDWKLDSLDQNSRELQAGDEQLDGRTAKDNKDLPRRNYSAAKNDKKASNKLSQGVYFKTPEFTKPGTYIYKIDEVDSKYEKYTTDPIYYYATFVVTDDGTGVLNAVEQHTASTDLNGKSTGTSIRFHNEYKPEKTTAKINVKKTIQDQNGNVFPDTEFSKDVKKNLPFTFTLTGTDENADYAYNKAYTKTLTIYGNDKGEFDLPITYVPTIKSKWNDNGKYYYNHYKFNLTEDVGTLAGFNYDQRQYQVEFDVREKGGSLVTENYQYDLVDNTVTSEKAQAEFVNTYQVQPVSVTISGAKQFTENMPAGTADGLKFGFTMKPVGSAEGSDIPAGGMNTSVTIGQNNNVFTFNPITYTRAGTYKYEITEDDLPKDPKYVNLKKSTEVHYVTVTVTDDGAGNLSASTVVDNNQVSNDGSNPSVFVTNEYTSVNVVLQKKWNDGNNEAGIRPSVQDFINNLKLYADGNESDVVPDIVGNQNVYTISYNNLPKYGNDGHEITYTVKELPINRYVSDQKESGNENGSVITNTLSTQVSGTKTWNDNDDQEGERPSSVTIELYADNVKKDEAVTDAAHEWKYQFDNLPAYDASGKKIHYTVSETKVNHYSYTVNGYDIVNTYTPDTVSIPVRKVWSDRNDLTGKRPESIKIQLVQTIDGKSSDVKDKTLTLSDQNHWYGSFENLPVKDHKKAITYSVRELDYKNSDAYRKVKISHDSDGGFTLTNGVKSGSLVLRKMIKGSAIPKNRTNTLNFKVINDETGKTVADVNYADLEHSHKNEEGEIILKDIPIGTYTVTETNPEIEGFEVKAKIQVNGQDENIKSDRVSDDVAISDNSETQILITDTYTEKTGGLSLTKIVTGSGDKNREFHFTVKLNDQKINGTYGDMEFKDGIAETVLKDGQTVKAENLPAGMQYEVTETEANQDGYVTSSENAAGEIKGDQNISVLFTNNKPEENKTVDNHPSHDEEKPSSTPVTTPATKHGGKHPETGSGNHGSYVSRDDATPDTSDHTNIAGWTSLMAAGIMVAAIAFITRRKYYR